MKTNQYAPANSFRSILLPLLDMQVLDAMVTVWLVWNNNPKSWDVLDYTGCVLYETAENK